MADLTLAQRFGKDVLIQETPSGLSLTITLLNLDDEDNGGDFNNGLGLDTSQITTDNVEEYASKILWALIGLSLQNQPESNNDDEVSIYISSQGKRPVTRNGVAQVGFQTLLTGYKDDTDGIFLDPDSLGSGANSNQL